VAISADGEYLAAGSFDNKVYLFEQGNSTPMWNYTTGYNVYSVVISADGEYLVAGSGSEDNKVYLFEQGNSTPLWSHTTGERVWSVAISADGEYLAAGSFDNKVYLFDHIPPTATIDSISPSPANEGDTVSFSGSGYDEDGSVVAYWWRSDPDGYLSSSASFSTDSLSVGDHTIYLKVQDDGEAWSPEVTWSLYINILPSATIDSIHPAAATEGDKVTFTGHGDDLDGSIVAYRWWSSLYVGNLSYSSSFSTDSLSAGDHTIYFIVQDDLSFWSEAVNISYHVNIRPIATVSNDVPTFAHSGQLVELNGSGFDNDGTVVDAFWTSDIDGILEYNFSLALTNLTPGDHLLSFAVRDDFGAWSAPALWILSINALPQALFANLSSTLFAPGEVIEVEGYGEDNDGNIISHLWYFDAPGKMGWPDGADYIDQDFNQTVPITVPVIPGRYILYFGVLDQDDGISYPISIEVYVNAPPVAIIDLVLVSKASNGTTRINLTGHGQDLENITLEWYSNLDGSLGRGNSLMLYNLSSGTHVISLRVRDDWGELSEVVVWDKQVIVTVPTDKQEPTTVFGLSLGTFAWLLILVAVILSGGIGIWQYNEQVYTKQIKEPLLRLRTLAERHEAAELEYSLPKFQRVVEGLTLWKYRSVRVEISGLEKQMNQTLGEFVEAGGLLSRARELADRANKAEMEFEAVLLKKAELAYTERKMEEAMWAATGFIQKLEEMFKENEATSKHDEKEEPSVESKKDWAKPDSSVVENVEDDTTFNLDNDGNLVCQACGTITDKTQILEESDVNKELTCSGCGTTGRA